MTQPPAHILTSFQVPSAQPVRLGQAWGDGWRCDRAVISRSDEPARATWIARVMAKMRPVGVAVARPISSSDGRVSVSGWRARTFLSGSPAPRFDEMMSVALRVNDSLAQVPRPDFLAPPEVGQRWGLNELFAAAEQAAFAPDPTVWIAPVLDADSVPSPDIADALSKAAALVDLRRPIDGVEQLVHADPVGCVIFDDASDPVVTDLVVTWRPYGWSAALVAVDCTAWASAPDTLFERWSFVEDFDQLLLRAVLYRLFVHVMHPQSTPQAWPGLSRIADVVAARVERA